MEEKKGTNFNFFVNILLGIIVIAFVFGTVFSIIKFNHEHSSLETMGYNQELINKIMNQQ